MSVPRKSSPPPASPQAENDLETTAELPVLDVAAYEASAAGQERAGNTDTWIMPAQGLRESRELHDTPEAGSAVADAKRGGHLEVNLHALADNLRDVEERLKRKGERLTEIERSLEESHAERAAAEQNAQQLAAELAQARAGAAANEARIAEMQRGLEERDAAQRALRALGEEYDTKLALRDKALALVQQDLTESHALAASYFESLQSTEGRRSTFEGISATLYWEIDERDARLAALQGELSAAAARAREFESELRERATLIAKLEKEINALAASAAQRDEQLRETAQAGAELQRRVDSLTQKLAVREERIRALESATDQQSATSTQQQTELERAVAEQKRLAGVMAAVETGHAASVATLQANLAASNERIRTLESKATQQNIEAAQRQDELSRVAAEHEATAGTQRKRAEQLEAELTTVRAELQQRSAYLQEVNSERSEHMARIAAGEARAQELEARMAEQQDGVRVLQADSNASVARAKELEGDLRAAEEMLNRMETDLRHRSTRLEEFEKTNQEWRVTVEEARRALTDRDSLIRRLEDEMAQSSVLLGSIQQSITRLDATGTSTGIGPGPGHDPAPDGDKRLLIRSEGDSDVVHVLGRKTSVGRTPDNDLQIDAKFISRHHAVILAGPAHTIIEDLNSTNGVLVNGRRITRQTLKDGDSVVIGKTLFRFAVRPVIERRN